MSRWPSLKGNCFGLTVPQGQLLTLAQRNQNIHAIKVYAGLTGTLPTGRSADGRRIVLFDYFMQPNESWINLLYLLKAPAGQTALPTGRSYAHHSAGLCLCVVPGPESCRTLRRRTLAKCRYHQFPISPPPSKTSHKVF